MNGASVKIRRRKLTKEEILQFDGVTSLTALEHFGAVESGFVKAGKAYVRICWARGQPKPDAVIPKSHKHAHVGVKK